MGVLIQGGEVITASERFHADVWVEGEVVAALVAGVEGMFEPEEDDRVLDASGCWVIPGGVDVQTSLQLEAGGSTTCDTFADGTAAAICGGTTTIIDRIVPLEDERLPEACERRQDEADGQAACDYSFHAAVTAWDAEVAEQVEVVRYQGVSSFEVSVATGRIGDAQVFSLLQRLAEIGGFAVVRAMNDSLQEALVAIHVARGETAPEFHAACQPPEAEAEAVARGIDLAALADVPIHVAPVSAALTLDRIRGAGSRGRPVFAETCPHYLLLSHDVFERAGGEGARFVVSPPLRSREDQEALWDALASGLLQVISSQHRRYRLEDKQRDDFRQIPPGLMGVGERLGLMHSFGVLAERITPSRWVELCCTNPAKLFGLHPRKGSLVVGADADLVVFDPQAEGTVGAGTLHGEGNYNAYEGLVTRGAPRFVLLRGRVVYESGSFTGEPGMGRFQQRSGMQPV